MKKRNGGFPVMVVNGFNTTNSNELWMRGQLRKYDLIWKCDGKPGEGYLGYSSKRTKLYKLKYKLKYRRSDSYSDFPLMNGYFGEQEFKKKFIGELWKMKMESIEYLCKCLEKENALMFRIIPFSNYDYDMEREGIIDRMSHLMDQDRNAFLDLFMRMKYPACAPPSLGMLEDAKRRLHSEIMNVSNIMDDMERHKSMQEQ